MRDTDCDRCTHFVVRKASGIAALADLGGKTIAMGAKDSPQATLIPTEFLRASGLEAGKHYQVQRFDVLVGKHGDHIGGELDAFNHLASGKAAASTMLDLNWKTWTADGTINASQRQRVRDPRSAAHCRSTDQSSCSSTPTAGSRHSRIARSTARRSRSTR